MAELQNQIALRETLRLPFALCWPSPAVADAVEVAALDALPPLLPEVESAGRAFIGAVVGRDAA
jgi:hypothetical protein